MRIGIGVTTYNRPKHIELCSKQIFSLTPQTQLNGAHVLIQDDSKERKGIAFRKNELLRQLKLEKCDYVFLFDDDCFPIKEGWIEFFIEAHKASGQHHFLYLKETPTIKKIATNVEHTINEYDNCGGAFMFLTKEVIEKVGAFDERFGLYGFEHANYSERIHMAGLTPMGKYLCPAGASEYIYAMDYDFHLSFNKQVNHKPSITAKEANESVRKAHEHFLKPIEEIYLPL